MGRSKAHCSGEVEPRTFTNTLVRAYFRSISYEEAIEKCPGVPLEQEFERAFKDMNEFFESWHKNQNRINYSLMTGTEYHPPANEPLSKPEPLFESLQCTSR